jgi:hypothetical protein
MGIMITLKKTYPRKGDQGGRRKRYGRTRLGIVPAQEDLGDTSRFLRTDARQGDSGRVRETWSERGAATILPACGTQVRGWRRLRDARRTRSTATSACVV